MRPRGEPVNRYETYLVNTCEQALKLKQRIGMDNIRIHLEMDYQGNAALESFVDLTDNMSTWVWRKLAADGDTLVREGVAFIQGMMKKHGLKN